MFIFSLPCHLVRSYLPLSRTSKPSLVTKRTALFRETILTTKITNWHLINVIERSESMRRDFFLSAGTYLCGLQHPQKKYKQTNKKTRKISCYTPFPFNQWPYSAHAITLTTESLPHLNSLSLMSASTSWFFFKAFLYLSWYLASKVVSSSRSVATSVRKFLLSS